MIAELQLKQRLTPEAFDRLYAGQRYELVDGEAIPMSELVRDNNGDWIVAPTLGEHGLVVNRADNRVTNHVEKNELGYVFGAETFFWMNRENQEKRAADIAFVAKERVKSLDEITGVIAFVPDFAVEVISPHDKAIDVRRKTESYMRNGARLLWNVYSEDRLVEVHRPGQPTLVLRNGDILDGYDVLPGLKLPVDEIFSVLKLLK
jgi:Uma2 family endonuclease